MTARAKLSIGDDGEAAYIKLRERAYRLLARREHSAFELRRKLTAKNPYAVAVTAKKSRSKSKSRKGASADSSSASLVLVEAADGFLDYARSSENSPENAAQQQHEISEMLIQRLLRDLAEQGAQSDLRFAIARCRWRAQNGFGPIKLRYELAEHQIPEAMVAQVMAEYDGKWQDLADAARRKKFGDEAPTSFKQWAKQARFLQQRGFASEQIGVYSG